MRQLKTFYGGLIISLADTALARKLVTESDLLRLKAIARVHARGLPPDVSWDDLLQEAFARVMRGSRIKPDDVTMVAFLSGVMRSLRAEHWRRVQLESHHEPVGVAPVPDPERALIAWQAMKSIILLFAEDPIASKIVIGLAEGLSAQELRVMIGISKTDYDSARRRMRRALLREGLTSCQRK